MNDIFENLERNMQQRRQKYNYKQTQHRCRNGKPEELVGLILLPLVPIT